MIIEYFMINVNIQHWNSKVDYIDMRDNSLVLRICPEERSRSAKTFTFSRTKLSLSQEQNYHFLKNTTFTLSIRLKNGTAKIIKF